MVEITHVGVVDMLDVLFVPKIVLQSQTKADIVIIGVLIKSENHILVANEAISGGNLK